jgi:alkylation response protein AidB-like acyl-CoA dehydrogenase
MSTTTEQLDMVEMVGDFARREVAPGAGERAEAGEFARDLWLRMGELGLHSLPLAEEYGGIGASLATTCEIARAFGRHGRDFGLGLSWISSMFAVAVPIARSGNQAQVDLYMERLIAGQTVGAQANTEPDAGSDLKAIRTRAVRDGEEWVINGSKIFITNAPVADVLLVLAVVDPEAGRQGLSFLIVERDAPGLTIGEPMKKMGASASPTSEVFFDDCRVPAGAILGEGSTGFFDFLRSISRETLVLSALTLGIHEACMDIAAKYAVERTQFGASIGSYQAISHKLADMRIAAEAGGAMVERVARTLDEGGEARVAAAATKVFVSEAAVDAGMEAVQILGGYGYMREYEVERLARDVKVMTIGGGTSEIQRNMIAKELLRDGGS